MRLAPLLADLSDEQVGRLAKEHLKTEEPLSRAAMCYLIEGVLKSFRFVQDFVFTRRPPTFALLTALLDASEYSLPAERLRELAAEETQRLCELVTSGEILGRQDQLRIYRRVLCTARRCDVDIDSSESSLLNVLRAEFGISNVEHFLLEHHQDLQEFWKTDDSLSHELHALEAAGLIFARDGLIFLAEDMAPLVRQTLGVDMPAQNARRLFEMLSNAELYEALQIVDARTSGSKDDRIERLLLHWVQPRLVLSTLPLDSLRRICRETSAAVSGSKDDLIARIIAYLAAGLDQAPVDDEGSPPVQEERVLDQARFILLFSSLRGHELSRILGAFPALRQSGSKEGRAATLWEAHRSETTLLSALMNREIEDALFRSGLKLGGSKGERIARLIEH